MKKNNEGYVLAMVMGVIAVLAVVASAMLGVGLRNVQTQQAAVTRMQAKYEAEGAIEIIVATMSETDEQTKNEEEAAKAALITALTVNCEEAENKHNQKSPKRQVSVNDIPEEGGQTFKYEIVSTNTYKINSQDETITVRCLIELGCNVKNNSPINNYTATVGSIKYNLYETSITSEGGA